MTLAYIVIATFAGGLLSVLIAASLTVTVLSRDVLLILGYALIHFIAGGMKVKPHLISKAATVLQMAAVLWALFKLSSVAYYWICVGAAVLTGLSGLIYIFAGMRLLAKHPSSSAKPEDQKPR